MCVVSSSLRSVGPCLRSWERQVNLPSTESLSLFHPAVTQNSIKWNPAKHPK